MENHQKRQYTHNQPKQEIEKACYETTGSENPAKHPAEVIDQSDKEACIHGG